MIIPNEGQALAAHACTQETIDRILDRIRATNPTWIERIEKAMQEPIPLERLVGPDVTNIAAGTVRTVVEGRVRVK
jgi:hypothetical protein